jgi:hypothetical protein
MNGSGTPNTVFVMSTVSKGAINERIQVDQKSYETPPRGGISIA